MKNLFYILTLICSMAIVSCGGESSENSDDTSISANDSTATNADDDKKCDMADCDMANCDMTKCEKKCDKKCDKNKDCDKASCEKYNCDKAEGCTAECMANCENPENCTKMTESDSANVTCDAGE